VRVVRYGISRSCGEPTGSKEPKGDAAKRSAGRPSPLRGHRLVG
jgi:hypothetical protein